MNEFSPETATTQAPNIRMWNGIAVCEKALDGQSVIVYPPDQQEQFEKLKAHSAAKGAEGKTWVSVEYNGLIAAVPAKQNDKVLELSEPLVALIEAARTHLQKKED